MSFTPRELDALGAGPVYTYTPWKRLLDHAIDILARPLTYDEAFFVFHRYVRYQDFIPPTDAELQAYLVARRLIS
jgi:hypothetical protein